MLGRRTNYDFVWNANYNHETCNRWATETSAERRPFGDNSKCGINDITDGTMPRFLCG